MAKQGFLHAARNQSRVEIPNNRNRRTREHMLSHSFSRFKPRAALFAGRFYF
jgi:hypothetical protein